jgi:hypothetical protein
MLLTIADANVEVIKLICELAEIRQVKPPVVAREVIRAMLKQGLWGKPMTPFAEYIWLQTRIYEEAQNG